MRWTEHEYRELLNEAWLRVAEVMTSRAEHTEPWHIDEYRVPPFLLMKCISA